MMSFFGPKAQPEGFLQPFKTLDKTKSPQSTH